MKKLIANTQKGTATLLLLAGMVSAAPQALAFPGQEAASVAAPVKQKVSGVVRDAFGEPVAGASVVEKGTQNGITTDSDGKFTLTVNQGAILSISFIGYVTLQVKATDDMQITLEEDNQMLEETVVVGYGTMKRSDVTGSVSSLSPEKITAASNTNALDAMQGKISGVNITHNAARPGGSFSVSVRGLSSINNSNEPLWVIDGIPSSSNANDLNPADIEKIDVLKDASATAIYGSRGANGVVIVTTKRGQAGHVNINYDGYVGARVASHLPDMMNGDEYVEWRTELFKTQGKSIDRSNAEFFTPAEWESIDKKDYTDWLDLTLRNGLQYSNTVSASGGNADGTFAISLGQLHEEGTVADQDYDRYNLHVSANHKILKNMEVGGSLYFTYSTQNEGSYETLREAYRLPQVAHPYDEDGNLKYKVFRQDACTNPLLESSENGEHRENKRYRTFGNIYLQYKPINGLTLKTQFAPQMLFKRNGVSIGTAAKNSNGKTDTANAEYHTTTYWSYVWDNQITYEKLFGKHKLTASAVQSMQMESWEYSDQTAQNFTYNSYWYNLDATSLSNVTRSATDYQKSTLASGLARVQYGYNEKYLLTVSGRADGSSRLAKGNKWAFFPSAALAWRITEEEWMKRYDNVSNLKLRLSYGVTGNDAVAIYGTQSGISAKNYDFGGTVASAYFKNNLANEKLSWEKTNEINFGIDFGFFKNRINGSVDLYQRDAKDLIMKRQLPSTSGWSSIWDNIGWVRNRGVELSLNTVNVQAGGFSWETNFMFSTNKNEIKELYGGKQDDVANKWFIGEAIDVNYDYKFDGIWQNDEATEAAKYGQKPGQVKVKDLNNDGVINADDKTIIGQRSPKWMGSMTNTFVYSQPKLGSFDLSVYMYTRQGVQLQDAFASAFMTFEGNYKQLDVDYWTLERPSNLYPQPGNKGKYFDQSRYVDVSFVKVGSISLGYTLPKRLLENMHISNWKFYFTTNNPFTFTDYKGFDPEWATQNTWGTATSYTTYLFGTKISF